MVKKIAGEAVVAEPTSREGAVYITSNYVYKTFGKGTNACDVLQKYKEAEAAGVPVPDTCKFTADLVDGVDAQPISGIRMVRASGAFFQLSKAGGATTLANAINAITNRLMAKNALDALINASQLGITDPQGFISSTANPPICFIDLHFRGAPNPVPFEFAIATARTLLARLDR
jgi:hypothetical protein